MTIAQYEIMLEALEYQMVDDEYRAHRQAFLNFAVQAEKNRERRLFRYTGDSGSSLIMKRN